MRIHITVGDTLPGEGQSTTSSAVRPAHSEASNQGSVA